MAADGLQNIHSMDTRMRALGQKYMGLRQDNVFSAQGGHDVLVDNFLNAQCM